MIDIKEMTVLVAEDSMPMCQTIHAMMKIIGYGRTFLFANNGKEALDTLQKEPVELVLMDYNMPLMTGGEALRAIREDRDLRDLPVIMVSAEAYEDYVAEIGESEIDAYVLKPLTIKVLEERVSLVIERANNPPPMVVHLKNARRLEGLGDLDGAVREAELARMANPKATRPIRELGYYYYKKNELEEAEKWLLKAAKLNRLDVFAFHHLGELYLRVQNIEKASYYFEKAMKVSPRQVGRGISFGKILVKRKMFNKAIHVFDKVLELPASTTELREHIADFCLDEGMYEYASRLFESLIQEFPKRADLLFKLGITFENLGNDTGAVTFFTKAAELAQEDVEIRMRLAKRYLAMNKPILAERRLAEIIRIDHEHEEANALIKQCY
jgi:CheY-like chemotaxis protein